MKGKPGIKADTGIGQVQLGHDHSIRDDQHDGGEHIGSDQDLGHYIAQLWEETDYTVGCQRGNDDGYHRGAARNDKAVANIDGEFQGEQDRFKICQCPLDRPDLWWGCSGISLLLLKAETSSHSSGNTATIDRRIK